MTKFREHRGMLDESMKTVVEIADADALFLHLVALGGYYGKLDFKEIVTHPYGGLDTRIGWNTWMVCDGREGGPDVGFSDGPIPGIRVVAEPGSSAAAFWDGVAEAHEKGGPIKEIHAAEDKLFLDFIDKQCREGDEALKRNPDPPGQTEAPGQPPGNMRAYSNFPEITAATADNLTTSRLLDNDRRIKLGHPNRPIDLAAFGDSIDAFQQWMFDQPLPTPKCVEDESIKRFGFSKLPAEFLGEAAEAVERLKRFGRISNLTMGLAGEAGEAVELLKKHLRDDTPIDLPHLKLELGDIAIVVSLIAAEFGMNMSDVLKASVEKVKGRIARGTLRGAGNDR